MSTVSIVLPFGQPDVTAVLSCSAETAEESFISALDRGRFDFIACLEVMGLPTEAPEERFFALVDEFNSGQYPIDPGLFWRAILTGVAYGDWLKAEE